MIARFWRWLDHRVARIVDRAELVAADWEPTR